MRLPNKRILPCLSHLQRFSLIIGLLMLIHGTTQAQCPNNNFFFYDMTPTGPGNSVTETGAWGGDYFTVNVCSGANYTFTTCASNGFDTELTLYDNATGTLIAYNDDACGFQSTINWTATFTGTVRILLDEFPCLSNFTNQALTVSWNTACGSGGGTGTGNNCSSPIAVSCGDTLTGETTIGNGNNASTWSCSTIPSFPGEDRFYELVITDPAITTVRVTLDNVVDTDTYLEIAMRATTCSTSNCDQMDQLTVSTGNFQSGFPFTDFNVPGVGTYYFIVDNQGDGITAYDISFDCYASGIEWDTSGCAGPPADTDRNAIELTWNGSPVPPLAPGETGTLCYHFYVRNSSGYEWLKTVNLALGNCWTNITNLWPASTANGYYDTLGTWTGTYNSGTHDIDFAFVNSQTAAWGDGTTNLYNCHQYTFCFQATVSPSCNDSANLINTLTLTDDGIGGTGNTLASTINTLSLGLVLPATLSYFDGQMVPEGIDLHWETSAESNLHYWEITKALPDGQWKQVGTHVASNQPNQTARYKLNDPNPLPGWNRYRLYYQDLDGFRRFVGTTEVWQESDAASLLPKVWPQPSGNAATLSLYLPEPMETRIYLCDLMGRLLQEQHHRLEKGENEIPMDLTGLATGTYLLNIRTDRFKETIRLYKNR